MENPSPQEVGLRLRAALHKLGAPSVKTGARMMGLSRSVLSNWLNGYVLPKLGHMRELTRRLPGLTLEWIYWGDDRLVPAELARELAIFTEAYRQQLELPAVLPEPDETESPGLPAPCKQAARAA